MIKAKAKHPNHFPAPQRNSEDRPGGLWATKAWKKGEKARYETEVLHRKTAIEVTK